MGDVGRRVRAVLLVLAVLVGAGVADRVVSRGATATVPAVVSSAVIAGPQAQTSAWYCAATAAAPSGAAIALIVTNAGSTPVLGVLETFSPTAAGGSAPSSAPSSQPFTVAPDANAMLGLGSASAASVVVDGGEVAVSEVVSSSAGWSSAPCASAPSDQWYFAHASTASGTALELVLLNPTATDAVVNVTFSSKTNGIQAPPAYQGLPVPATSAVVVNVGDHVPNDDSIATAVTTLSGTVVADEMAGEGAAGNGGVSILNGTASPLKRWAFPHNVGASGASTAFTLYNPGATDAHVLASLSMAQGQLTAAHLVVPAGATLAVPATSLPAVSPGVLYGLTLSVVQGPGIVAQREVTAPAGSSQPNDGSTVGQPVTNRTDRWLLPQTPPGIGVYSLAVVNLSSTPVRFTLGVLHVGGLVPLPGALDATLPAGALASSAAWLQAPLGSGPVEVEASGPVAVELDPLPAGAPGTVVLAGWPLLFSQG